jgi:hypothetical protein
MVSTLFFLSKKKEKPRKQLMSIYSIIPGTKFETSLKTTPNWESTLKQRLKQFQIGNLTLTPP